MYLFLGLLGHLGHFRLQRQENTCKPSSRSFPRGIYCSVHARIKSSLLNDVIVWVIITRALVQATKTDHYGNKHINNSRRDSRCNFTHIDHGGRDESMSGLQFAQIGCSKGLVVGFQFEDAGTHSMDGGALQSRSN